MAIVLDLISRFSLLELVTCLELEDAIDELEGLGFLGFQFWRKNNFSQKVLKT